MTILKKKRTLTAFLFPKLWTLKTWLDKSLKSPLSENPFARNMGNVANHCWNQHHSTLIIFLDRCQRKLSWKPSLLLTPKIFSLLLSTLAADEKYLLLHSDNLTIPIQMQLSEEQKTFSWFFAAFFKIYLKFWTFWTKRWPS